MGYDPINKKNIPSTFVIYDTPTGAVTGYQVQSGGGGIVAYP
jgi:hypothetical protein